LRTNSLKADRLHDLQQVFAPAKFSAITPVVVQGLPPSEQGISKRAAGFE
jgi:hypothetical protein